MKKSLFARSLDHALLARDFSRMRGGDPELAAHARRHLAQRMGRLRGLPQKLGQSLILTASPEEESPFSDLAESAEPLPFSQVEPVLEEAWATPWRRVLADLEPHGRAASLGQVHKGVLPDGRAVAVKISYPGIREAVVADLRMLGWLAKPAELAMAGFQFAEYRDVLLKDLEEELDYRLEAQQQQDYARLAHPGDLVTTPEVIARLSTENVLTTTWEDGETIEAASQWPERQRFKIASVLAGHFLRMLFEHGLVHADPHPGNYRFHRSGRVVLYDYGSVARLEPRQRLLLMRLILAAQQRRGDPFCLLEGLGFKADLLEPIRSKLPALCQVLFEPFLHPGRFDPDTWDRTRKIEQILGEDRWNFRMSGPASYIFLIRAFQGVFYYLGRLKVQLSWSALFDPILKRKFPEVLAVSVPAPSPEPIKFDAMARHLHIQVLRNGAQTVALKFPASAVDRLESLMGEAVLKKVGEAGWDLEAVVKKARANGLQPMDLFELREQDKTVKVWLA